MGGEEVGRECEDDAREGREESFGERQMGALSGDESEEDEERPEAVAAECGEDVDGFVVDGASEIAEELPEGDERWQMVEGAEGNGKIGADAEKIEDDSERFEFGNILQPGAEDGD